MEDIYELVLEMGLGALMYIPGFIKIGPGIQKLILGYTH
jgi:hypothetical protein